MKSRAVKAASFAFSSLLLHVAAQNATVPLQTLEIPPYECVKIKLGSEQPERATYSVIPVQLPTQVRPWNALLATARLSAYLLLMYST
jgi:hypothetical protein